MTSIVRVAFVLLCLAFPSALAATQSGSAVQADRVASHPDLRATTRLQGHVPLWAVEANDRGAIPADTSLRLTLVLSRSPELQASFTQLLADQQNPSSPSYHQWLTPEQVGERYGATQHDLDALRSWLGSQGLAVVETAYSRVFVSVVAPASTVAAALATSFHTFDDHGQVRMSATVDPSIPTAFAPIVSSISGLADTDIRPMHHGQPMPMAATAGSTGVQPQLTNGGNHFITPGDFATIFDLKPIYSAGYTGAGQKVAIIERSRVVSTDITEFEANTGLATNLPHVIIPTTGSDPGVTNDADQAEAMLDVERVIGTAPAIQADLIASSAASGGIYTAALYEVQTVLDPVMTISFGACEAYRGATGVSQWDTLFSQAASEGISVFVSSGDSGAAGCDAQFSAPPVYQFPSINYICASSYATCVGGTEFAEGSGQYWSTTNGTGLTSALSYIPEGAWNEPLGVAGLGISYIAASGGGGASIYVPKPAWQTGTGVPADSARDVPDVSFPSSFHDGYYGCYAAGGGDCAANRFYYYFGTSAAAPSMAAVTALLNQKTGGSQGNLNPLLYRLAASSPNAFHDATPATINGTVCAIGTASICNNSTPGTTSLTGGLAGYALTTGYDQATGLGSLDVANFLSAAASLSKGNLAPTVLTLQNSPTILSDTQTAAFTASLTSTSAGTPTGTVQFYADGKAIGGPVALASGMAVTAALPFPMAGTYYISATYSGDSAYAPATAPGFQLIVTGVSSMTKLTMSNATLAVGTTEAFNLAVSPGSGSGIPSGVVRVVVSGPNSSATYTVPLSNGTATTPAIPFPTVGSYTLVANYQGDSVFSASGSGASTITVQKLPSNLQLSSISGSIGIGGARSFGAFIQSLVAGSTAPGPSGTIQLFANGVALGSPFAVLSQGSQNTLVNSPLEVFSTAGTYAITAVYSGDANWMSSTASGSVYGLSLTVLAEPASYQLIAAAKTLTFTAGTTSTFNQDPIQVIGGLGFAGTVTLSCSIVYNGPGVAAGAPTCSLVNSSVVVAPTSASSANLIINTTARSNVRGPGVAGNESSAGAGWRYSSQIGLCGLLLCLVPRHRRAWRGLAFVIVFAAGFNMLTGCGGGSSTSTPPPTPVGTTAGSYTVTVTASTPAAGVPVPAPVTIALTIN